MLGEIGITHHRSDAQTLAFRELFDPRQREAIDIDQCVRRFHAHLHQIDQIRAAAEKFSVSFAGDPADCFVWINSARVT